MKTINVLASDFKRNSFYNTERGMLGCPLERAFTRAGCEKWYGDIMIPGHPMEHKVIKMFEGEIPIEDFSFEFEIK